MLSFIGVTSFAENTSKSSDYEDIKSCIVAVETTDYNSFTNRFETSTSYHYLGEVANNGFGNIDCELRANRFVALN